MRARITSVSITPVPPAPTISGCYTGKDQTLKVLRYYTARPTIPRCTYISPRECESALKNPNGYDFLIFKLQSTRERLAMPLGDQRPSC